MFNLKTNQLVTMATTTLAHFNVSPTPDALNQQSLPLLHFDTKYLLIKPQKNLVFYKMPILKTQLMESIVPQLKSSLSLTLKHFLPYAGRVVIPLEPSGRPFIHYAKGDSIRLTFVESDGDFIHLSNYHARDANELNALAPESLKSDLSSDSYKIEGLAVQVTLFPNQGLCIGFTHHHVIGDACTSINFIRAWASVNRSNSDAFLIEKHLPSYDRSSLQDPDGLDATCWEQVKPLLGTSGIMNFPENELQRTFVYNESNIQKLKNIVSAARPDMGPTMTSFVVVCGHVWSCLAKSSATAGEAVVDDEPEYFTAVANCRSRLNPPVPNTYFGNCLARIKAELSHGKAKGFVEAAMTIKEAVTKTLGNGKGILDGAEREIPELYKLLGKRWLKVSSSPRYDAYEADFGWGRPIKFEDVRPDEGIIFLSSSRDFKGGIEVGLPMSKIKMDSFAAIFDETLK